MDVPRAEFYGDEEVPSSTTITITTTITTAQVFPDRQRYPGPTRCRGEEPGCDGGYEGDEVPPWEERRQGEWWLWLWLWLLLWFREREGRERGVDW